MRYQAPLPDSNSGTHDPIEQQSVLLTTSTAAQEFLDFLKGEEGRRIIESYGYSSASATNGSEYVDTSDVLVRVSQSFRLVGPVAYSEIGFGFDGYFACFGDSIGLVASQHTVGSSRW